MNNKFTGFFKRNIVSVILVTFFLALSIRMFLGHSERINSLQEKKLFSVGNIESIRYGAKVSTELNYTFIYNNRKYESSTEIDENSKSLKSYIGKKYFVKFSVDKPRYSELYLDKPVPENFDYTEGENWKKIPVNYE